MTSRLAMFACSVCALIFLPANLPAQVSAAPASGVNLAAVATPSSSYVSGDTTLATLNSGYTPRNSRDNRRGSYGNWNRTGTQWVEYDWSQPVSTREIAVYWWDDHQGVHLPKACRLKFWDGNDFVAVTNADGLGVAGDQFNVTKFAEVTTSRLRLEMDSDGEFSTGLLQWKVYDSGKSPDFPPTVNAGVDRDVMLDGKTYLSGAVKFLKPAAAAKTIWSKASGPGKVKFADAGTLKTTATFSKPGEYVLTLTAGAGKLRASSTLRVKVTPPPPTNRLDVVYTKLYQINSPFWNARTKALIVNWIPHCIDEINSTNIAPGHGDGGIDNFVEAAKALRGEPHAPQRGYVFANAWVHQTVESMCIALMVDPQGDPDIIAAQAKMKATLADWIPHCIDEINSTNIPRNRGDGGIDNFVEAAKALRGEPHAPQKGYVFANAWVHQTVESMCIALMVDPQGDSDIIAAQDKMKATLEDWIPKILAAQEPDGYLQTAWTLRNTNVWRERWSPQSRGNHEGYTAGYFIESAINHYTLTSGKDKRLYDAAKKLADCWVANIGPGKKEWFDGHEEMEQALVRFGRFVNDMEGGGHGDSYIKLSKFLLDCRRGGTEYDQSQSPVQQQYEAVGHAVRASYLFSGMADVAAETHDLDYQSAVISLWDTLINKKYYVTGGIGSGETSEGFGGNYSLRNEAYNESCSSCGLIFFHYKMNLAYHDAKYADLYEETIYNALLGATDLEGKNYYYDNPLVDTKARYPWHNCPCCVGNIPRTLLMLPTWTYAKSADGIYVNLFVGSTINVGKVAGTDLEMVQKTDYPWSGIVAITVNPKESKKFTVYVRLPNRTTSALYTPAPEVSGFKSFAVNGETISPKIENGYAVITRQWKAGDNIDLVLPMKVQIIKADEKVAADRGRVALRYGPLIYNVEQVDQPDINLALGSDPLTIKWRGDLLDGVMVIKGKFTDGEPLLAIPNYARLNRGGRSMVWMKSQ